jgi:hypothetical protein
VLDRYGGDGRRIAERARRDVIGHLPARRGGDLTIHEGVDEASTSQVIEVHHIDRNTAST